MMILSEIGARNIGTVEHLLPNHGFQIVLPRDNYFGGLGIYIHKNIFGVQIMDKLSIQKSCRCSKYVIESLYMYILYLHIRGGGGGGIYRYLNDNIKYFLTDLENALTKIDGKYTAIISGDISIDHIKFD